VTETTALFEDRSIYAAPLAQCPLCGSEPVTPLYAITRFTPPFRVDRCAACGFIFMNPRFNDATVQGFYNESYYRGNAEYSYFDEREAEHFARYVWNARLRVIRRYVPEGNFLDVGCSFGGFLRAAPRYYTPLGIEPSAYAGTHARNEMGSRIHVGTLADHPFLRESISVITMIEVLEHMADPASAVRECAALLRRGGVLVIQTANMEGLQAKHYGGDYGYFLPGHLSYFGKRNLTGLLLREGFSEVVVYRPVEFGLLPKPLKSRGSFRSLLDYRHWIRISLYHMITRFAFGDFSPTSSMVVYAIK